jgi:hypothetical protein
MQARKKLIQNKIDLISNQPFLLNSYMEFILSDIEKYKQNNLLENDFTFFEDNDNSENKNSSTVSKVNYCFNYKPNCKKLSVNSAYCKKHFDWLFNQKKTDKDLDLFSMFSHEDKKADLSSIKNKKVARLKRKLIEFCSWMNDVFSYDEPDFEPVSLIKIFIVNYENTISVPIKIEEIFDSRLKRELLKTTISSDSILKPNKSFKVAKIKKNAKIKNSIKYNNKWYLPKKIWFKK